MYMHILTIITVKIIMHHCAIYVPNIGEETSSCFVSISTCGSFEIGTHTSVA